MKADSFHGAMRDFQIEYDGPLVDDGDLHRFKARGDKARDSWYVLHAGPPMAGAFGCWKRGVKETWCAKREQKYSSAELVAIRACWKKADEQRKKAEAERRAEARAEAVGILELSEPAQADHPYLARKGIKPHNNLRQHDGALVVALRDASNAIQSLQFIAPDKCYGDDGEKRDKTFLCGGQTKGSFFLISGRTEDPLVVCEGYATGSSIHEATGYAVACAMYAGNLKIVAEALRAKWPERQIIVAADNDQFTKDNPGLTSATEAAKAIGASLAVPQFNDLTSKPTDFNDLHRLCGIEAVTNAIKAAENIAPPSISERIKERLFNPDIIILKPEPVFSIGGIGVCTAGNLAAVSAQAKHGKTAFIAGMQGSAMTTDADRDFLGVASSNLNSFGMIHIDTEQSLFDHHDLTNRTARRAGLAQPPHWFRSYCLTGFSVPDLQAALHVALEEALNDLGGIHSVFLDGVADFVSDVNCPEESNAFIAKLHATAIKFHCPIIGIIHLNPGTEKTRGHLGSQLERKAETNLRLEKADEITVVWADKNRRAPILKDRGPRFRWDDAAGMHVSCEAVEDTRTTEKIERLRMERDDVFSAKRAMRYSDLLSTVKNTLTVSDKTAERRITDWRHHNMIENSVAGLLVPKD